MPACAPRARPQSTGQLLISLLEARSFEPFARALSQLLLAAAAEREGAPAQACAQPLPSLTIPSQLQAAADAAAAARVTRGPLPQLLTGVTREVGMARVAEREPSLALAYGVEVGAVVKAVEAFGRPAPGQATAPPVLRTALRVLALLLAETAPARGAHACACRALLCALGAVRPEDLGALRRAAGAGPDELQVLAVGVIGSLQAAPELAAARFLQPGDPAQAYALALSLAAQSAAVAAAASPEAAASPVGPVGMLLMFLDCAGTAMQAHAAREPGCAPELCAVLVKVGECCPPLLPRAHELSAAVAARAAQPAGAQQPCENDFDEPPPPPPPLPGQGEQDGDDARMSQPGGEEAI